MQNATKRMKALNEQEREISKLKEKTKCACCHQRKGDLNIVPMKNRKEGQLLYICKSCEKDLNLKKIQEADLDHSLNVVDNAIDVIKISLDPQNDEQAKVIEKMAGTQYIIRNQIKKLYGAALKSNNGGNGKKKSGNQQDSSWNRPEVGR